MPRLPKPGSDTGTWGTILNNFLEVSHNSDGTLKSSAVLAAGAGTYSKPAGGIPASDLSSTVQSDLSDAASAVQLGGDLGGTTTSPMIAKLQGTTVNASSPSDTQVLSYNGTAGQWVPATIISGSVSDATTNSKGIVQLAGDLGGSGTIASAPVISDGAITNSKLADGAVTTAKLAAASVTSNEIADGTITNTDISGTAAIAKSKLAPLNIVDGDVSAISEGKITNLTTDLAARVQLAGDLGNTTTTPNVTDLHLSGDTAIGHKLTNVTDPTNAQDAATKHYVDNALSSAGISRSINAISGNTNAGSAANTDYVYFVSGTTTLTLPTAVGNTNRYTVKNTGAGTVTIATTSAQTIDGSASASLSVANTSLELISDNANWRIV